MVMVFTLISETQEYLNQAVEDEKKSREKEKLRKIKEAEQAELVCYDIMKVVFLYGEQAFFKLCFCSGKNNWHTSDL